MIDDCHSNEDIYRGLPETITRTQFEVQRQRNVAESLAPELRELVPNGVKRLEASSIWGTRGTPFVRRWYFIVLGSIHNS